MGQRLGDTSAGFQAVLEPLFDDVLAELASRECIKSLRQIASFNWIADQRNYDTQVLSGLTDPHFPSEVLALNVLAWGSAGRLLRTSDMQFEHDMHAHLDGDGVPQAGRPTSWRLYPNEQTLQVNPVPRSEDEVDSVELLYLKPPSALLVTDNIVDIRAEHMPVVIAGMIKHGLVFADSTLVDRPTAIREFEVGIIRMRGHAQSEAGRDRRTRYVDW